MLRITISELGMVSLELCKCYSVMSLLPSLLSLFPSLPSFDWVRETYRQRFGIETTYRELHQARIRTSTRYPEQRLLYVGIALILRNVWVWLHQMVLARPRRGGREIRLDLLRFRRMLLWLTHVVEGTLGVRDSVIVELQL